VTTVLPDGSDDAVECWVEEAVDARVAVQLELTNVGVGVGAPL
jgi:hypothetical protein